MFGTLDHLSGLIQTLSMGDYGFKRSIMKLLNILYVFPSPSVLLINLWFDYRTGLQL